MEDYYIGYVGEYFEITVLSQEESDVTLSLQEESILPKGLCFDSHQKKIAGCPEEVYRQTITMHKKDEKTGQDTFDNILIIIKEARQLTLLTKEIPDITAGTDFQYHFEYKGGTGEIEFTSDTLPDGLALSKDGCLKGNVFVGGGMFPLFISVKDKQGHEVKKEYHIRVRRKDE
ncbi:hypothetical protein [Candidatus Stoquefichus massiliensis]|uniref:hypothetical protein n=1 Tax=Candidatus Stoquefichus massiliensis TaxID=1470350 RepID=UPI000484D57E|nr:hypothetical protein [Candidatus Stoquefichus massiliensis]